MVTVASAQDSLTLLIDTENDQISWEGSGFSASGLDIGSFTVSNVFFSDDVTTNPNPGPLGGAVESIGTSTGSLETTLTSASGGVLQFPGNEGQIAITIPSAGGQAPDGRVSVFLDSFFNNGAPSSLIDIEVAMLSAGPYSYSLSPEAESYLASLDGVSLHLNSTVGGSVDSVASILVIPEPSVALLSALGSLALFRRRTRSAS